MKKDLKHLLIGILIGAFCMAQLPTIAAQGQKSISVLFKNIKLMIDGRETNFEPFIYNDKTYVPLEDLTDYLNLTLEKNSTGNILRLASSSTAKIFNEFEANNTPSNANVIEPSSTIKGNIGSNLSSKESDRTDWFKVHIPSSGTLNLGLFGSPNQYLYLSLYGKGESYEIASIDGENTKLSLSHPIDAGTYYIKVNTNHNASSQPYTLTTSFNAMTSQSEKEPNDTKDAALPYSIGEKITGNLGYTASNAKQDSEDWYTFKLNENKEVKLNFYMAHGLGGRITLYSDAGDTVILDERGQNQTLSFNKFLTKGTYSIKIKSTSGAGIYSLRAQ